MQQFVIALFLAVISYALTPKPKIITPTAGKLDIPSPRLGDPIPVIFGEVWIRDAQVSYYGNPKTSKIRVNQ